MTFEPAQSQFFPTSGKPVRGIQPGQAAWSSSSQKLHRSTEVVTKQVVARWQKKDPRITWAKKLSSEDLIRLSRIEVEAGGLPLAGVAPDGGVVLYNSRSRGLVPLFTVEAKEQQNAGNAIERWFKNYTALKVVGPKIAYVTFCSGEGATPNGAICKALNHAFVEHAVISREYRLRRWNKLHYEGPSMFRRPAGFRGYQIETILDRLMARKVAEADRD